MPFATGHAEFDEDLLKANKTEAMAVFADTFNRLGNPEWEAEQAAIQAAAVERAKELGTYWEPAPMDTPAAPQGEFGWLAKKLGWLTDPA